METQPKLLAGGTEETMQRFIRIEKLVEEMITVHQQMVEYEKKRDYNKESLGAFRRGEIQTTNKLWMSYGDLIVKMPRKNIVAIIEQEQVKTTKLIEDAKIEMTKNVNLLMQEQPDLSQMDPYVVQLLLQESEKQGFFPSQDDQDSD